MSQQAVKDTILSHLKESLKDLPSGDPPIHWENARFDPPSDSTPWIQVAYLPSNPVSVTLGEGGIDELRGLVQLTLCVRAGTGERAVNALASAIETRFTPGSVSTSGGQPVTYTSTARAGGFTSNGYWRQPVSIYFLAQYPRNTINP